MITTTASVCASVCDLCRGDAPLEPRRLMGSRFDPSCLVGSRFVLALRWAALAGGDAGKIPQGDFALLSAIGLNCGFGGGGIDDNNDGLCKHRLLELHGSIQGSPPPSAGVSPLGGFSF